MIKLKKTVVCKLIVCMLFSKITVAQNITFVNPILSGFYPDPSVVQVEKNYYLVNSTFSYYPGLPIFQSTDLKNWKQIGSAINRTSQMNFNGDKMTRGLFAPSISYHNGIFYITCTYIDHQGNFVITAKSPAGPWSNPIWLPQVKGIDPSLFFDDNNKAYIVYNSDAPDNKPTYSGHRTIRLYEIDPVGLKTIGKETTLVNGGVDISKKPVWIEGPHILKKNEWYYLYAAEGGTSVNHSQVVFRSKSVLGPYIAYENNPILTQRDLPEDRKNPITSTGHAQFVEGPDGKTYAVFLACRPYEGDYYNTGRETFIAPVDWVNDWPIINHNNKEVKYAYTANFKEDKTAGVLPQSGNYKHLFTFEKKLDASLMFMRSVDSSSFFMNKSSGLTMKLKPETLMDLGVPSFIGKRQQHLNCTASTEINFTPITENEKAGLAIFQDEKHFYYLCKSVENGKPVLQLFKSNIYIKEMDLLVKVPLESNHQKIKLRIDAVGAFYSFYFTTENSKWKLLKDSVDGKFLSTKVAGGFIGCFFGLYATSSCKASLNSASFKYLEYIGNDKVYRK